METALDRLRGMKHIDTHVHCRDWNERDKATIASVMQLARLHNIVAICDMPNTKPAITTRQHVEERLNTAERQNCSSGYYVHIGATSDKKQLIEAAETAETNPKVAGIKLVYGRTTNELSILEQEDFKAAIYTLAREKYSGVLVLHLEKESLAQYQLWRPELPSTWNDAKPWTMELTGAQELITYAGDSAFRGHLHIAHVSVPETVALVDTARKKLRISCGITPHHLLYNTEDDMQDSSKVWLKVNPPIRAKQMMLELRNMLRLGMIDSIETDHAPHLDSQKIYHRSIEPADYMSGIRSMAYYTDFLQWLVNCQHITEAQIADLTYNNMKKAYRKIRE